MTAASWGRLRRAAAGARDVVGVWEHRRRLPRRTSSVPPIAGRGPSMRRTLLLSALALWVSPGVAISDARSAYLVRLLQGSSQFRVRAQAAISLGALSHSPESVAALAAALRDGHPAVRAASAVALGRLGDTSAVAHLEGVLQDREQPVRDAARQALSALASTGRPRFNAVVSRRPNAQPLRPDDGGGSPQGIRVSAKYYVALGQPASAVSTVGGNSLAHMKRVVAQRVAALEGVELAPLGESEKQVQRVLTSRRLKGFFLETSITDVQARPGGGTRVAVSIILATYPGRDMRAILQGAATAVGGGHGDLEQALEGAVTGALRKLPQALSR